MVNRPKINSISLRQNFGPYYEEIFSRCQIVVSSSDSFFWAGEYPRFFGGLAIFQKLPTKNLVGLEIIQEPKFCFAEKLYGFNPSKNSFEEIPFELAKERRLLSFLAKFWPRFAPKSKILGFKIHILSESHCGGGLGTTGVLLACLAACLYLLAGKITPEELKSWELIPTSELIRNPKYQNFQELFRLAWCLTAVCRGGYSSGATSFGALIRTPYPIFYFSKDITKLMGYPPQTVSNDSFEKSEILKNLPFWGGKLDEIFPLNLPLPWPIDIGRVYSGLLINTEHIFRMLSKMSLDIKQLQEKIDQWLAPKTPIGSLNIKSIFAFDKEKNQICSYHDFMDIFNILSVKLAFAFYDLFNTGPDEENLRHFIACIHQIQDFNHFLGHSTPVLDEICQRFTEIVAKENEFNLAGAKIEGIGKGGHILFMGPAGTMSDKLSSVAQDLSQEFGRNIYLDWASWIDGFGESGLTIEQFLQAKIYSDFISSDSLRLTSYKKDSFEIRILNKQKAEKIAKEFDLLLYLPDHKIFIRGSCPSSKEIPSAKATLKIFKKILNNPEHKISNKLFDDTAYGQSRYDLHSKIFIPLNKALQKYAGKKLDFRISGGMYDNFNVCVKLHNLSIGLVENIE